MLRTRICELLDIRHPVVLGGMASGTNPALVAAVSNAGGLGILGATFLDPEQQRADVGKIRALTTAAFGLNHLLAFATDDRFATTLAAGPRVVSTAWAWANQDLRPYFERAHGAGAVAMHMVSGVPEAVRAAEAGVDIIVAQGTEGGGHVGLMGTMALVPLVVRAVAQIPVLAAGGVADGSGLAAALALGADGVLLCTRFLATPEAPGRGHSKDVILNALGSQTVASTFYDDVLGQVWPGAIVRTIKHPLLEEWADRPQEWALAADQLRPSLEAAISAGDFVLAGESAGLVHDIVPAAELVARIARQAEELLDG